jgi:hypothetical protein
MLVIVNRMTWFVLVVAVALAIAGCGGGPKPKYGLDFNGQRAQKKIPAIPNDWVNYNTFNNANEAAWRPPGIVDYSKPYHARKSVRYYGGTITDEMDVYYSGKSWSMKSADGGTDWESIVVSYSYEDEQKGRDPWTCGYHGEAGGKDLTLDEAETMLKSWGINRLP